MSSSIKKDNFFIEYDNGMDKDTRKELDEILKYLRQGQLKKMFIK